MNQQKKKLFEAITSSQKKLFCIIQLEPFAFPIMQDKILNIPLL